MKVLVKKLNAFTNSLKGGNPAGVLLDSPHLTDKKMAHISEILNVSETAFVYPSKDADYKIRFFTPTIEVDLCGHATIATFYLLAIENRLSKQYLHQETRAGILPIRIEYGPNKEVDKVLMSQAKANIKDIHLDIYNIADSMNISVEDIDNRIPFKAVSTGLFTLPICVKGYDILKEMKPNFEMIKKICEKNGIGSYHVFSFETLEEGSVYHARNFAPYYSINEDPVTGTANGAICSFLLKYKFIKGEKFICEQGDIIGRPGRVFVDIKDENVMVGGVARVVEERKIEI